MDLYYSRVGSTVSMTASIYPDDATAWMLLQILSLYIFYTLYMSSAEWIRQAEWIKIADINFF